LARLYADYDVLADNAFADFHVSVDAVRRFPRALCTFRLDGLEPFTPLALDEAFAFLEWGMNWCVTSHCHTFVTIHSAVLEREGRVLLMPAPPGSGKSTLCAALALNGWRLMSDELGLLDPSTGLVFPSTRPVSLKNKSIDIIRGMAYQATFGPVAYDTMKGTVAHMRPPATSVERSSEPGLPAWLIFPKYLAGSSAQLIQRPKAASLMQLAENSFNYNVLGKAAFDALGSVIERSDCYDFTYSRLDEAIATFAKVPLPDDVADD